MKVFLDASGRSIEKFGKYCDSIRAYMVDSGHSLVGDMLTEDDAKTFYKGSHDDRVMRYKRSLALIKKCDVAVFEVSTHSISMGFLIQKTLESSKPVIAMHLKGYAPYFLTGIDDDKLQVIEYEPENIKESLDFAIDFASDQQDTRFNFFISPRHQNYLDWVAKTKKIPRSVYLRDLIEKDMEKQEDY